ncbi:hypothetical protein BV898_16476 [Hypsibius exemplaris]|uniref:Uncharacterized protein n=1 Tax=Hypsibius exemplaris TaxID=2072580 RepID=A0A9X6ND96_HYPEX|nr:hypothetical protein BV898_16476 [Hypsibius exemplaris]
MRNSRSVEIDSTHSPFHRRRLRLRSHYDAARQHAFIPSSVTARPQRLPHPNHQHPTSSSLTPGLRLPPWREYTTLAVQNLASPPGTDGRTSTTFFLHPPSR